MKEKDLAAEFVDWLEIQNWDVYQEVQFNAGGAIADIVATRGPLVWIVEVKLSLTLKVMEQAARWPVHLRSVAVKWGRNDRRMAYRVAREMFKVGVLECFDWINVSEEVPAPLMREYHQSAKRMKGKLTDLHKTFAQAGSTAGSHLTPYKRTMIAVKKFIEDHPGCTIGEVYEELGKLHYASGGSAKSNLLKSLRDYEDWVIIDESSRPYKFFAKD